MTGAKHWIVNFARNRSPMTYKQVILFLKGSLLFFNNGGPCPNIKYVVYLLPLGS